MHIPPTIPSTSPLPVSASPAVTASDRAAGNEFAAGVRSAFERQAEVEQEAADRVRIEREAADLEASIPPVVTDEMKRSQVSAVEQIGYVGKCLANANRAQEGINQLLATGRVSHDHPKVREATQYIYGQLLAAQTHAQTAGLSLEAASKIVESGTSGVRTVLQTQT